MIAATQMRPGNVIKHDGELYTVFSVSHRTPGNLRGFVQAKLRNLRSGSMMEHRFRSEDRIEQAVLDEIEMEYLYADGEDFHFMNSETYEQIQLAKEVLGDGALYLIPNVLIKVEFYEGKPVGVSCPRRLT
jgi:elongation factor P